MPTTTPGCSSSDYVYDSTRKCCVWAGSPTSLLPNVAASPGTAFCYRCLLWNANAQRCDNTWLSATVARQSYCFADCASDPSCYSRIPGSTSFQFATDCQTWQGWSGGCPVVGNCYGCQCTSWDCFSTSCDPAHTTNIGCAPGWVLHGDGCCYEPLETGCPQFYEDDPANPGQCRKICYTNIITCPSGYTYDASSGLCVAPDPTTLSKPWCVHDELNRLHIAYANSATGIQYQRSDYSTPPFASLASVTSTGTDTEPRMIADWRGRIVLLFGRSSNVFETVSTDDGNTWSTTTVAFTGGKHPDICIDPASGAILRAAYVSGKLQGTIQYPGDSAPSSVFTLVDQSGANLAPSDDTFHISPAADDAGRWVLVFLKGNAVATYMSLDDGRTWQLLSN